LPGCFNISAHQQSGCHCARDFGLGISSKLRRHVAQHIMNSWCEAGATLRDAEPLERPERCPSSATRPTTERNRGRLPGRILRARKPCAPPIRSCFSHRASGKPVPSGFETTACLLAVILLRHRERPRRHRSRYESIRPEFRHHLPRISLQCHPNDSYPRDSPHYRSAGKAIGNQSMAGFRMVECPHRVIPGKPHSENMFSGLPPIADRRHRAERSCCAHTK
jgi:hypothetical protein